MRPRIHACLAAVLLGACATADVAINRSFDFSRVKRVAVIGFKDYSGRGGSGDLVSAAFEQSLIAAGYEVVERGQVSKVLAEQKISGRPDPKATKALGQSLGVDALLIGQITDLADTKTRTVIVENYDDRSEPVYVRRSRRVQQADGTTVDVDERAVDGYRTVRRMRREPRTDLIDGRLGVSARLVYVPTAAVLWSGSQTTAATTLQDGAHGAADDIMKAVKSTWPSVLAAKK